MQKGVKLSIAGGALILLSTLFVPQGISEYARAAADGVPAPASAPVYCAIGAVLIAAAIGLLARGYVLRSRDRNTVRGYDSLEAEEATQSRPGYFKDRPGWMDRPVNHMGDNYGHERD